MYSFNLQKSLNVRLQEEPVSTLHLHWFNIRSLTGERRTTLRNLFHKLNEASLNDIILYALIINTTNKFCE